MADCLYRQPGSQSYRPSSVIPPQLEEFRQAAKAE
jgi:hypothetical protein